MIAVYRRPFAVRRAIDVALDVRNVVALEIRSKSKPHDIEQQGHMLYFVIFQIVADARM